MDQAAFKSSPSGRLVPTIGGKAAFIPNPLPPPLDFAPLALSLAAAAQRVGELNGIGRQLRNPYLIIRPLQTREALTSSSMGGTHTSASDLFLLEAGASEEGRLPDTREVLNYTRAATVA